MNRVKPEVLCALRSTARLRANTAIRLVRKGGCPTRNEIPADRSTLRIVLPPRLHRSTALNSSGKIPGPQSNPRTNPLLLGTIKLANARPSPQFMTFPEFLAHMTMTVLLIINIRF
jgi:hypothetical protein